MGRQESLRFLVALPRLADRRARAASSAIAARGRAIVPIAFVLACVLINTGECPLWLR
jgi:hypothetical protein